MGNQQVSDLAKAWLGGIIDGEGSISIDKQNTKDGLKMGPCVAIVNTEIVMINTVATIFNGLEVGHHITTKRLARHNKNHQDQYLIRVRGFKRIRTLLNQMLPFLVVKRKQAELMLEFVEHRLTLPPSPRSRDRYYRDWEIELADEISRLNRTANLRDYEPDFLGIEIEDIVRTGVRASEAFRNERPPQRQLELWSEK